MSVSNKRSVYSSACLLRRRAMHAFRTYRLFLPQRLPTLQRGLSAIADLLVCLAGIRSVNEID